MNQISRVSPMMELLPKNIVAGTPSIVVAVGSFSTPEGSSILNSGFGDLRAAVGRDIDFEADQVWASVETRLQGTVSYKWCALLFRPRRSATIVSTCPGLEWSSVVSHRTHRRPAIGGKR